MSQTDSESSMFSAMASILQFVWVSDLERRRHSRRTVKIVIVQGFKVQRFKVPFSSLECIWDGYLRQKRQLLSGLIQNLEPIWQLFGEMSIFNEDFGSLMPFLSLTLNAEP
jgi:hypothetical protein